KPGGRIAAMDEAAPRAARPVTDPDPAAAADQHAVALIGNGDGREGEVLQRRVLLPCLAAIVAGDDGAARRRPAAVSAVLDVDVSHCAAGLVDCVPALIDSPGDSTIGGHQRVVGSAGKTIAKTVIFDRKIDNG